MRPTEEADLPALSDLTESVFGRRRSPEALSWLVLGGSTGVALESRVCELDGRIVGHVAALAGRYALASDRDVLGVHPILWLVTPEARGRAAVQLGGWCVSQGDFNLIVGGTPWSQPILDRRGFLRSGTAVELRLATDAATAGERSSDWRLTTGGSHPPSPPRAEAAVSPADAVVALPDAARLAWLAACPTLETIRGTLVHGDRAVGPVLLYVNRGEDATTGRIVHLPPVTDLTGAPRCLLARLAEAGCSTGSYLASSPEQRRAAEVLGGEPFYERPIFYRSRTDLPATPHWHLTYLEGDLAYRRV